jgi:hypothetical protein
MGEKNPVSVVEKNDFSWSQPGRNRVFEITVPQQTRKRYILKS